MCHSYAGADKGWDRPCGIHVALLPQTLTLQTRAWLMPSAWTKGHEEVGRTPWRVFRQPLCLSASQHITATLKDLCSQWGCTNVYCLLFSIRYCMCSPKLFDQRMNLIMLGILKVIGLHSYKQILQRGKKNRGMWIHVFDTLKMREKYMGHRV